VSPAAAVRHGRSRPDACSILWDRAQVSALGTAPLAVFWVALEQNGPWGAQAATQSHLDPDLGRGLDQMCKDAGGRFLLIRCPDAHSDPPRGNLQRVYLAGGLASTPWLLEADLADPARLSRLDADMLRRGDAQAIRTVLPELRRSAAPVLMICANSRRDICCSVRGRPVAVEAALERPGQVWECSHTGGHRFAPTGVLLPYGQAFGRLSGTSGVAVVDAAGRGEMPAELLGPTYDRGRSHLAAPGQAAESVVRQRIRESSLLALTTAAVPSADQENTWDCRVSHVDGRRWDVMAVRGPGADDLPESCGKEAVPTWEWSVQLTDDQVNDCGR
jgi:hypothetical protein